MGFAATHDSMESGDAPSHDGDLAPNLPDGDDSDDDLDDDFVPAHSGMHLLPPLVLTRALPTIDTLGPATQPSHPPFRPPHSLL